MDRISVFAPGSVSNLGPGFDCLGVALTGRGDQVDAVRRETPGVLVRSVSDPRVPTDPERNTAAIAAAHVLRMGGAHFGLELKVEKGLPLAGGLGGSAASAVAGAVAAEALLEARLSRDTLLQAALEAEAKVSGRHADNVAPSLLGGAVLVVSLDPLRITHVRLHNSLSFVLATPEYGVETAKARAVLPREVPRGLCVAQTASLGALLLGLERGDADLIRDAMVDRIAEPARASLYAGYAEARRAGLDVGAAGVSMSGAGPTVMAIVVGGTADPVAKAMVEAYARKGIGATSFRARVDSAGARVVA